MERLRLLATRAALIATTATMVFGNSLGIAQAADISSKSVILSNNQVSATGVTYAVAFTNPAGTSTAKCIMIDFDASANLTGTNANVYVDFSNESGGTQVLKGTITYTSGSGGSVKVPTNNAMAINAGSLITVLIGSVTNGSTATSDATITINTYSNVDCATGALDLIAGTPLTFTLVNDRVTQNVGVARALSWKIDGNTTHEYRVDPANNTSDTQANTVGITTNADSYSVYVNNTTALTRTTGIGSTASTGTLTDSLTGTGATPATMGGATATSAGTTGFGYNIASVTGSTKSAFTSDYYAAFTLATQDTNTAVLTKSSPTGVASGTTAVTAGNHAVVTYKAAVNYSVPQGYYTTVTVYTVTPTYN